MTDALVPTLLLGLVASNILSFVKAVRGGDKDGAFGVGSILLLGVGLAFLTRESQLADQVEVVSGLNLSIANAWTTLLFGLAGGSVAGTVFQFKKAIDADDTAAEPGLSSGLRGLPPTEPLTD
jgi:hypothetical protein